MCEAMGKSSTERETMRKIRTFCIDGDRLDVVFRYDDEWNVWLGDYPYFKSEPRLTPSGRPWRNAVCIECPYSTEHDGECGCCPHFVRQKQGDMIGVCFNERLRERLLE